jgi:hypothetical protein
MKKGTDFDHIHPTCSVAQLAQISAGSSQTPPVCIPTTPDNNADGSLLQIMPWPSFSNLTDHHIEAIYAYLSSIPCIDNNFSQPPDGAPDQLRNDCGKAALPAFQKQPGFPSVIPMRRPRR